MRKDDIMPLSEAVRSKTWEDAKGTFTSPSLIAPPAVEFCIHKKIPSNKRRTDTRQGTIDQDPEFMAFLESLANPTQPKDIEAEDEDADKPEPKVSTTPLIEYLKEKKANKGKDGSKKNSRNADGKGKGGSKDDETSKKKGKGFKEDKSDKPKETIKILTKKAATEQAAEAAKNAAGQINASNCSSTADAPKSRRANIAAAARILQRDLGLSPGSAHRRARQDAAKADAEAKTDAKPPAGKDAGPTAGPSTTGTERPASPAPSDAGSQTSKAKSQSGRRNRGGKNADKGKNSETPSTQAPTAFNPPVILKKKPEGEDSQPAAAAAPEPTSSEQANTSDAPQSTTNKSSSGKSQGQKKPASISPDATRAFVKHANASQGVTDAALREALERFGSVTGVEVDKRKGFAYVDFADHEGLVKAISGSPVTVGQGSVQVLERKEKKPANQGAGGASSGGPTAEKSERNSGRGRRGRGGGGGKNAANDKNQSATPAEGGGG
jgi:regulator of nonsense transcripts 3